MSEESENSSINLIYKLIALVFGVIVVLPMFLKLFFSIVNPTSAVMTFDPVFLLFNTFRWGAMFLSLGIGLTLGYKVFKFPNFAVGEYFLIGGYSAVYLSTIFLFDSGDLGSSFIYIACAFAFLMTGLIAVIVDKGIFKLLRENDSKPQTMMITSLGVSLGLRALLGLRFKSQSYKYQTPQGEADAISIPTFYIRVPLSSDSVKIDWVHRGQDLTYNIDIVEFLQVGLIFLLVIALFVFLKTLKFGKAIRAVASNPDLAASSGINVERMYTLTSFIIGGFAGVGGALYAANYRIELSIALELLLPAFAVIVLGSVGSLLGALIAAVVVGFARVFSEPILSGLQIPTDRSFLLSYNAVIPFLVLILVLLFYTEGIGERIEEKFNSFSFRKLINPDIGGVTNE